MQILIGDCLSKAACLVGGLVVWVEVVLLWLTVDGQAVNCNRDEAAVAESFSVLKLCICICIVPTAYLYDSIEQTTVFFRNEITLCIILCNGVDGMITMHYSLQWC